MVCKVVICCVADAATIHTKFIELANVVVYLNGAVMYNVMSVRTVMKNLHANNNDFNVKM